MRNISMIGLGAMGSALARAFIRNELRVTVWNRSPEKATPLIEAGAHRASGVAEALRASPLVLISVLDYPAVRSLLEQAPTELADRTLVNLTNGTPAQARELSTWVRERGAEYIDGAVMTTPELIGQPDAFVLYSGSEAVFRTWESALDLLGHAAYVGEDAALAALYDLALLSAMFGMFSGYLHAAALLRSGHVSVSDATPMIVSLLKTMADTLPQTAQEIDSEQYPQPTSNNTMMATCLKTIVDGSAEQGVDTSLMSPIWQLFHRGSSQGLGQLDISALPPLLATPPDENRLPANSSP